MLWVIVATQPMAPPNVKKRASVLGVAPKSAARERPHPLEAVCAEEDAMRWSKSKRQNDPPAPPAVDVLTRAAQPRYSTAE